METSIKKSKNHKTKAALWSIIPGLGQLYNKQYVKGLLFLLLAISFIFACKDLFNLGYWGLFTLGTEVPRDNSIFLLAEGIIALLVTSIGLIFYYINILDARRNGAKRDKGIPYESLPVRYKNLVSEGFPYLITSPAFFLLLFVVVFPLLFSFSIAFTNYNLYNSPPANLVDWVGFKNFINIFKENVWRDTLISVFSWTVIWSLVASTLQIAVGIGLAVLVHQKGFKGKAFVQTMFILPWAVPGFVTILIFSGLFNDSFGAVNNQILAFLNIDPIPWMTNPFFTKIALIFVQVWLGFPFIFIMVTGILQSIPNDLYEAANIDGASSFYKFSKITLPLILFSISPILITQYVSNFNNFGIIYLFNGGGPAVPGSTAGGTDILISWIYNLTIKSSQYSMAAAITILLSIFVLGISLWQFRRAPSYEKGGAK
jgi:arabinogalactan oligomer / maltooligosaccharide transport system permease protein